MQSMRDYICERIAIEDRGYETPCWIWQRCVTEKGYALGTVPGERKNVRVHRAAYEEFVGPIPPGLQIDHLCRVRNCVNPEHLEPVTNRENALRGIGPTALLARKTRCHRGHEYSPETIRDGRGRRVCAVCRPNFVEKRFSNGGTHCRKGHEYSAENTRTDYRGNRRCRECDRISERRRYGPGKMVPGIECAGAKQTCRGTERHADTGGDVHRRCSI